MNKRNLVIILVFITFSAVNAFSQEEQTGYNPFVTGNLDDLNKMFEVPVVEGSYHRYNIVGDPNYTDMSTFVWYVENGTFGNYDPLTDTWLTIPTDGNISNGSFVELPGIALNTSQIWVRWNDDIAGAYGYIAVYERSSNDCILDQKISGWKHLILVPPEVWLLAGTREDCADQLYSVSAQFNRLNDISYPYTLYYSYPGIDGVIVQENIVFEAADLDASNQLHFDFIVGELDNTVDESYTFKLEEYRDQYGSYGKIAPLGSVQGQYPETSITITHLPQTGVMNMN
ncbi:MAG: hypothetical protein ACERKD_20760 [Prolixibacteraceae bacterium]